MMRKTLESIRVALVCTIVMCAFGTAGPAGAAAPFTVCYDRATRLMHFSPLGRCYSPRQVTLVVGGARGAVGADGTHGVAGPIGSTGAAGIQGPQGVQGPAGPPGGTGTAGTNGGTGALGGTGTAGTNGATGGTGQSGSNTFVTFTQADSQPSGTSSVLTVTCPGGNVAVGGGFHGTNQSISGSEPTVLGNGWRASYISDGTSFSVFAICVVGTNSPG